ncbi:MAG: hypothetical protein QUV20_04735 [Oceanibaculum nanhaiense]|nr:hypothetical protein [Oceanibaculum nanhaiense]MDM7945619.1 hypothetical protein [Oceanibaculum nanhaiense]
MARTKTSAAPSNVPSKAIAMGAGPITKEVDGRVMTIPENKSEQTEK